MRKVILQYPSDTEEGATKIRGIMHMHTKHVKVDKQTRNVGVYGATNYWTVSGMFGLKENAEIARKEIDGRL